MISPVLFWVVAFITVIPALALLFARKSVHVAMAVVLVMVGLAVSYVALAAPFLGVVQIVVYTGAVMMLFLFTLMLVGVDSRESLKETITGQRWIALGLALGLGALLISVVSRLTFPVAKNPTVGEPVEVASWLFGDYVLVVEVLGFLLITSAVGALVLTHVPRLFPKRTQAEIQAARVAAGADPVNKAFPGVYARHNALDAPALGPDGAPLEDSVSRVLKARSQTIDGSEFKDDNEARRRELGAKEDDA
ncbi:NADH-quinone oxidoreductase subunit J [Demequina sp. TTPB684]|uniref:NADH-quinone oxidoreductase subunit J n=1 Tax=unclassified Demequina TaxID=2620311 RepID=UPI001CF4A1E2|nr:MULTISPECIES: NADH-quinone oxidoreductase subunit J [unclassified Demequina]MCB2411799.1 NADH-quinone oxidoreductase subunit J [Demequina sp. TTPB684]UPU88313.1 NADH-quinone oxidoreductase subunit J [Demequina sp. TMPB413]